MLEYIVFGIPLVIFVAWFIFLRAPTPTQRDYQSKFEGKVVVITGASSGLGEELAIQLSKYKPKLVLAARSTDRLAETKAICEGNGAEVLVVKTDVSNPEDCKALVDQTLAQFVQINVLFLNAGISQAERVRNVENPSILRKIMETNYFGCTDVAFYALPSLRTNKGHIVVTSSVVSKLILPGGAAYCASKAAVNSFFDTLRAEEFKNQIKVTIVCPGFVRTNIIANSLTGKGEKKGSTNDSLHFEIPLNVAVKNMIDACVANKMEVWYTLPATLLMGLRGAFPNAVDRLINGVKHK